MQALRLFFAAEKRLYAPTQVQTPAFILDVDRRRKLIRPHEDPADSATDALVGDASSGTAPAACAAADDALGDAMLGPADTPDEPAPHRPAAPSDNAAWAPPAPAGR